LMYSVTCGVTGGVLFFFSTNIGFVRLARALVSVFAVDLFLWSFYYHSCFYSVPIDFFVVHASHPCFT
jgi:hypothetical protein